MWGNTVAIHNVLKEKNQQKQFWKKNKKMKKKQEQDNFGRKKAKKKKWKKWEKNMRGKLKLNSQPAQY